MNFDQMMAELRVEYVASFPSKINDIEKHYVAQDLEKLRDDFHKLKGTGKTYGIAEVSVIGELVEKLCLTKKIPPEKYIPAALDILANIYAHRLEHKPFIIESYPKYLELLQLTTSQ